MEERKRNHEIACLDVRLMPTDNED
uniref:Uncharacterized protein n=1 Tax=Rhizophora mucronata TaxID=61149 RepID=A0A2P2P8I7_RHIMU